MNTIEHAQPTFEDFYRLYPRKKSRADALKAWGQVLKAGTTPDEIMAGLRKNLDDLSRRDPQFRPYPASWLRAGGWGDEPDPVVVDNKKRSVMNAARDLIGNSDNDYWLRPVHH